MGIHVYSEGDYKIYKCGNGYIVHNTKYDFKEKHSHIGTFKTAKSIIYYAKKKIIPKNFSQYLLTSLIRVADDNRYIDDIKGLVEVRSNKSKKQKYKNKYLN